MSTLREFAEQFKSEMQCNCDLDKWEPERDTGHSFVCRIHIAAKEAYSNQPKAARELMNDQPPNHDRPAIRTTCLLCGYERPYEPGAMMSDCPVCPGNPPQKVIELRREVQDAAENQPDPAEVAVRAINEAPIILSKEDVVDIIHQAYAAQEAELKALREIVEEQSDDLKRLRGAKLPCKVCGKPCPRGGFFWCSTACWEKAVGEAAQGERSE